MPHEPPSLAGRIVLLDTNLAILLCVGNDNPADIEGHKRLDAFMAGDFLLLRNLLAEAVGILLTPNTATEISNLLRSAGKKKSAGWRSYAALVSGSSEEYVPSAEALDDAAFARLGLTDTALLHALANDRKRCLLTTDIDLYLAAGYRELEVFNFNHWRGL